MPRLQARCVCGSVVIAATFAQTAVEACHCDTCRRWSAGPLLVVSDGRDVEISGDELRTYASSDWAERGFCGRCGTSLFFRTLDGEYFALSATVVDGLGDTALTREIFIDSKPGWYALAGNADKMTGAEFLAQFDGD